jgi:hypothetical protein
VTDAGRIQILKELKRVSGIQGTPGFKVFMEREDGTLDCTDGAKYPAAALEKQKPTKVLIVEVAGDPAVPWPSALKG